MGRSSTAVPGPPMRECPGSAHRRERGDRPVSATTAHPSAGRATPARSAPVVGSHRLAHRAEQGRRSTSHDRRMSEWAAMGESLHGCSTEDLLAGEQTAPGRCPRPRAGHYDDGVRVVRCPDTATAVRGSVAGPPRPAVCSAAMISPAGVPSTSPATPTSCSRWPTDDRRPLEVRGEQLRTAEAGRRPRPAVGHAGRRRWAQLPAARNFSTTSALMRPRALTSMPCPAAHARTAAGS